MSLIRSAGRHQVRATINSERMPVVLDLSILCTRYWRHILNQPFSLNVTCVATVPNRAIRIEEAGPIIGNIADGTAAKSQLCDVVLNAAVCSLRHTRSIIENESETQAGHLPVPRSLMFHVS